MKDGDQPIIVEQLFDASLEKVWNALTVVAEMTQWYFPNIPAFEPVVGFETTFIVQVEDRVFPHVWKLTEVMPMRKIAYNWQFEGYDGRAVSVFELSQVDQRTRLTLTFSVIEKFPEHIPEFKRESGVNGWNYLIKESLIAHLEKQAI